MKAMHIIGGRVIDPGNGVDVVRDVFLADGKIVATLPDNAEVIDATGKDCYAGLARHPCALARTPSEDKETSRRALAAPHVAVSTTVVVAQYNAALIIPVRLPSIKQRVAECGGA